MAKYYDSKGKEVLAHRVNTDKEMPYKKQLALPSIPIANSGDWRINREGKISYISHEDFVAQYHRSK